MWLQKLLLTHGYDIDKRNNNCTIIIKPEYHLVIRSNDLGILYSDIDKTRSSNSRSTRFFLYFSLHRVKSKICSTKLYTCDYQFMPQGKSNYISLFLLFSICKSTTHFHQIFISTRKLNRNDFQLFLLDNCWIQSRQISRLFHERKKEKRRLSPSIPPLFHVWLKRVISSIRWKNRVRLNDVYRRWIVAF